MASTNRNTNQQIIDVLNQIKDILNQNVNGNNNKSGNDSDNQKNGWKKAGDITANALSKIVEIGKQAVGVWSDLQDQNYKLGRSLGFNLQGLESFYAASRRHTMEMAKDLGIQTQHLMQLKQGYTDATNRAQILNSQQLQFMGAMSKFSDVETINKMVGEMDNMGASVDYAMATLAKSQNLANKWGLNAKKNASLIAENIHLATSYSFNRGVDGLSRMVSQAQKLKINVESIANISEKFTTLEGAIETSANLQVLGGSYAMQFGNPLEVAYEAMTDLEAFQDRIIDTFSDKGVFNRKTGVVEFSPVDRIMMKEAGKQLGLSAKEIMNLANQQVKIAEIEGELINADKLSNDDKELITSLARYDEKVKGWVVDTLDANGKVDKPISVKEINESNIDAIKRYRGSQEGLYNDVASIRQSVVKMAGDTKSAREWYGGAIDDIKSFGAEIVNGPAYTAQHFLQDKSAITSMALLGGGAFLGGFLPKIIGGGISNIPSLLTGGWKKALAKTAIGAISAIGAVGAGYIGVNALENLHSKGTKSAYGSEDKNGNVNAENDYITNIDSIGDANTYELRKQTILLAQIADNSSIGYNEYDLVKLASYVNYHGYNGFNYISTSKTIEEALMRQEDGYTLDGVGDVLSNGGSFINGIGNIVSSKLFLNTFGSKLSQNMFYTLMAGAPKLANPLGWLTFGSEMAQVVSGQEDNKTWSTMNGALGGATIGATIGSVIPVIGTATGAVIGGAIGGVLTGLDEYFGSNENAVTDAIKDLPSAMQGRFETSKFGSIDINDPQIERRANYAIVKIHDLLITWFHAVAKKEDFEIDFTEGLSSEQIKNAEQFGTTSIMPQPIYQEYGSGDIYSMPIAGQESYVSRNYQNVSYYNNEPQTVNGNIDLNINGTLKLTSDNNIIGSIDIDRLLNNPEFKNKVVEMVLDEMHKLPYMGRKIETPIIQQA